MEWMVRVEPCWRVVRRNVVFALIPLTLALSFSGCRKKRTRVPTPPPVTAPGEEVGIASWYGHPYHGRRTANGEIYDMERLTAAHRTRPFNQWVRVHNLDTGTTVDVRINDRGPFIDGRIIDLSLAAARTIDMVRPGTAWVRIETVPTPQPAPSILEYEKPAALLLEAPGSFAVQAGAFEDIENAERMTQQLNERYGTARLVLREGAPSLWRVLVGEFDTLEEARALAGEIQSVFGAAFVVRIDDVGRE